MAGGVAHDVNQTLTLIAGHAELGMRALGEDPVDVARVRDALAAIARAASGSAELTRRLLEPGQDAEPAEPQAIELAELLRDVARFTSPRWRSSAAGEGRAIRVAVEVDGDPIVVGWLAELREALTNLIFNAVDALPRGGTIHLRGRRAGDLVDIEVVDTGVGMTPEVRARVFEPFFTTKGATGTGLGLAQVAGMAERHGGQVAVWSKPGGGTTFRLSLPASPGRRPRPAPFSRPRPAAEPIGLRVLVVDDEPAVAETLALLLEDEGHSVAVALSAAEALASLAGRPFDLVISDHLLGEGATGLELAAEVRRRWPATPVALLTAWGSPLGRRSVDSAGLAAVLEKPYRIEQIRALTARVAAG
jgi:CheY-like chemotaxis protein/anti-sigma regulatory factor (Ser/Thr protein kinase)